MSVVCVGVVWTLYSVPPARQYSCDPWKWHAVTAVTCGVVALVVEGAGVCRGKILFAVAAPNKANAAKDDVDDVYMIENVRHLSMLVVSVELASATVPCFWK